MPEPSVYEERQGFFRLLIPADLADLPKARRLVEAIGQEAGLPETRVFDLQVCVSEATANAIEHAASDVEIEAWLLADRVIIEVTNDGVFQPGLVKNEDTRRRGLGLPLMVSLADQVHVSRLETGKTKISLTFFLPGALLDMPGTAAARAATRSAADIGRPPLALWVLLAAFAVAVAVLAPLRQTVVYNPAGLFTAANIIFLTLVSLFVSVLAARAYLRDRPPAVLLIGCGTLALGLGALLAAVRAGGPGTNPIPATYNTAALLAGLCYLGAAVWVRPTFKAKISLRPWVLSASFGGLFILLVLLVVLIRAGVWPLYFVQEQGQTIVGSTVARTSAVLFAISALAIMFAPGAVDVGLRRWYGLGLGMIAVGLAGVSLQLALGDPLNWVGRASQYMGCLVILAGIAHSARKSGVWSLPLERALEESERRYRNLVDLSPDAILVDVDGKHAFANAAAVRLLGAASPRDLVGRSMTDSVYPDDRDLATQRVAQVLAGGITPPSEIRMLRLDGTPVTVEMTGSRVEFDGRLASQAVLRDITDRKRAESVLRQREATLRAILDSASESIWLFTPDGMVLAGNDLAFRRVGRTAETAIGTHISELAPAEVIEPRLARLRQVAESCRSLDFEDERAGVVFHHTFSPVMDSEGQVESIASFSRDITERKQAEEALRQSEARFSVLTENLTSGVALVDEHGMFSIVNKPFLRLFDLDEDSDILNVNSRDWSQWQVFDDAGRLLEVDEHPVRKAVLTRAPVRDMLVAVQCPGRTDRKWLLTSAEPILDAQGGLQRLICTYHDITERREAEQALRESEELHRLLAAENERLYRQQLDIAENLQFAFLNIPSEIGAVRIGHLYRSATEAARIGGDFYDVFEVKDGQIAVLIGDVSGHGIRAARTATLVKDVVHAFTHQTLRTEEVLQSTNALLVEKSLPGFVSVFLGILDQRTGRLRYSVAGHPDSLLRRASGQIERLGSGTSPLGVYSGASWEPAIDLEADDILVLYTDGVIEARTEGRLFGEQRLEELLRRERVSPERLPDLILDQVLAFSQGELQDDVAVLALSLREVASDVEKPPVKRETSPG